MLCFAFQPIFAGLIQSYDRNKDGNPDEWLESIDDGRYRLIKDRNFDGSGDYAMVYDDKGTKEFEELDYNFDGIMDDFYYYSSGVLTRREVDTNYDKKIDIWVYLDEGVYIRKIQRDLDFDGVADLTTDYGSAAERE